MSRTIPAALQVHLNQSVTTTCRLLRIALRDGRVFGVTSLDADVTYNDGRGAVTYSANQGIDRRRWPPTATSPWPTPKRRACW
jgi:hypothetical protein